MSSVAAVKKRNKLWEGGNQPFKVSYGKLMMWFFLVSDAFTFSAFLTLYASSRFSFPQFDKSPADFVFSGGLDAAYWPIPEKVFHSIPFFHGLNAPLVFVGIMTFILILSSVTMVLAVEAGHHNDKKGVEKWMLWTIIGGIAFIGCQAWEWSHFIHGSEMFMPNGTNFDTAFLGANLVQNQYGPTLFANLFFFITGFHGTHVLSGIIINIIIYYNTVMGVYEKTNNRYEMIEKVGLYWHFVDLVWVFVFTLFYLI